MVYTRKVTVHLRDTDSTGVIYFAEQLRMAQETLELYLAFKGLPLKDLFNQAGFFLPIVHAEADYLAPVYVGDVVDIELFVTAIGASSFTLEFTYRRAEMLVGRAKLVHVVVDKASRTKTPIPELLGFLRADLSSLPLV